jgi:hypothetical protein
MWRTAMIASLLLAGACAGPGGTKAQVDAVVQDETARQAAVAAAQRGDDSKDALKAGAEATDRSKAEARPPT